MTKLREMLRQSPLPNLSSPSKNNLHKKKHPMPSMQPLSLDPVSIA
jgi:hypothetical protein